MKKKDKKIFVFTQEKCPYCTKLKDKLDDMDISFIDVDINLPENEIEFGKLMKHTGCNEIPIVIVGKQILLPNISFHTIKEASLIIQKLSK